MLISVLTSQKGGLFWIVCSSVFSLFWDDFSVLTSHVGDLVFSFVSDCAVLSLLLLFPIRLYFSTGENTYLPVTHCGCYARYGRI